MRVPAISIANSRDAAMEVTESLRASGFAVISDHGIEPEVFSRLYSAWGQFFKDERRFDYKADVASQNGYFSIDLAETAKGGKHPDIKEYFQYRPGCRVPGNLASLTGAFYDAVYELGRRVHAWIQECTPATLWRRLDKPLASYLSREHTMCRILHYPPLTGNEVTGAIRAEAHEDINFLTLLPAATARGLEIKPRGHGWMPVEAAQGSIVINIGDMLQELTDGVLPSTTHRVVNPASADNVARVTAPVFCHPVASLRLSDRHTAGSYLKERLREINPDGLKP